MIEEKIVILQRFCVRSQRTHAGEEIKSSWLAKRPLDIPKGGALIMKWREKAE